MLSPARRALHLTVLLCLTSHASVDAGDWPQILGPNRDGRAIDEPALQPWGGGGPKKLWSYELGEGYAGPAVVGDRVIVFHRVGTSERIESIDRRAGKQQWKADFDATYRGGINSDTGPRCVPVIHGDSVYVFGAAGDLHCVSLADGKPRWSRSTYEDFSGQEGYFGAGSTPIIADGKVLVNVGGRDAGLVAFDAKTGETVWRATSDAASYSSPTVATINGQAHVVFVTRLNTVSVDPSNGKVRFQFPFGRRGPTVNAATPLVFDSQLFVSAAYGVGANLSKIGGGKAAEVWANDDSMSSQYSTCVYRDGYLYGTHGREDFNNGELRCIEAQTGHVAWSKGGFGVAHVILVGDKLLALNNEGLLRLVKTTPDGYDELASTQVSRGTTRGLPALSNGQLFLRDNGGRGGTLVSLQVAK